MTIRSSSFLDHAARGGSTPGVIKPEPRIRVLIIIPTLGVGGAEMDLTRNVPRIDRSHFEIIVCAYLELGPLAAPLSRAGIEVIGPLVHPWQCWRHLRALTARLAGHLRSAAARLIPTGLQPLAAAAAKFGWKIVGIPLGLGRFLASACIHLYVAHRIARQVRAADIQVIHAVLPGAYIIARVAKAMAGRRPLVMSRVSLNWYQAANRPLRFLERWAHRGVDCAIGNCEAVLGQLRAEGVPGPKLRLVYNGIDVAAMNAEFVPKDAARHALGLSPDVIVLSSVANLFAYKGHQDLLEALSHLRAAGLRNWVLLVVGRDVGNNLARLRALAGQLDLSDRVRFLGLRLDVPAVLSAADIHVSASHYEGFPNNVLEAMCAGLPVVATGVGGVAELVVDGGTGLLVPPRSPGHMARALHLLASDPERRQAMGAAGRARVQACYTIERSVAAFEDVYARLACKPGLRLPIDER